MSIRAIPYQPVNFTEPLTVNTCKSDPIPALIGDEDPLIFEFGVGLCDDATQLLDDTTFATEDWQGGAGWNIATGKACAQGGFTEPLSYAGFSPAPGTTYVVRLTIDALNGGFVVSLGGDSVEVGELGTFDVALSAGNTDPLTITPVSDQVTGCFASVELFQQNTNIGFRIVGCDGDEAVTIYTATPDTAPQWFEYFRDIVRVNIPMTAIGIDEGCFAVEVFDSCTYGQEEVMQSQTFKVTTDCDKTILFRVCNDEPSMGLTGKYLQARIKSNITQPSYPQTVQEERLSDGRWVRHFADLQVVLTLNVEITDSTLHPFLAALFTFDHLYLDGREYLVDAQEYRPGYSEDGSNAGGSRFSIRPKQALLRRVLCDAQGEGCDPANDPICNTPNATASVTWDNEGNAFVEVVVLSNVGFVVDAIRWAKNGTNQTPVPAGAPGAYQLGPLVMGDSVVVTLVNAADASCNFTFDAITIGCDTLPEGVEHFSFTVTDTGDDFSVQVDGIGSGWFSVLKPDGSIQTFTDDSADPVGGSGPLGVWCWYVSDEEGRPVSGLFNGITINGNAARAIQEPDLSGVTELVDGALIFNNVVFSTTPNYPWLSGVLTLLNFENCILPSNVPPNVNQYAGLVQLAFTGTTLAFPPNIDALVSLNQLDLGGCDLTTLPSLDNNTQLLNIGLISNALPLSELVAAATTLDGHGQSSGLFDSRLGTNAVVPSLLIAPWNSLVAKSWTIFTN